MQNGSVDRDEFVAVASRDETLCNALATQIIQSTKVDVSGLLFYCFIV
jgi:hypothetical protein